MAENVSAADLDLSRYIKPGDAIVTGQACGEPTTILEILYAQRAKLGGVSLFTGSSFSGLVKPDYADHIKFRSMGAIGALRSLTKTGALEIIPSHVGQLGRMIADGDIACDVAIIQVSPANADGLHSPGLIGDYVHKAVKKARVVIAEVNAQVPNVPASTMLNPADFHVIVECDRAPVTVPPAKTGEVDQAIARHAANFIQDGSILQIGIGAVPDAILQLVKDRRDLGVHSGMIGDGLVDLVEAGVITNATHGKWKGLSVTGALIGSERLYRFAHNNESILLADSALTHDEAILSSLPKLVSINSAIEVDLTGQVNAETAGENYLGGTGGQVDYVRGGSRSPGGHSIIALPSTAKTDSRVVSRLSGPVTTGRSEVDVIITEYGAAQLKGRSLRERAKAMIEIAHPDQRDKLSAEAHDLFKRGF
jgi:acyl-CoA hydrolase